MAAGDVVNTASRLQSSAPVNGILVDETTYRATQRRDRLRARPSPCGRRGRPSRSACGVPSSRGHGSGWTSPTAATRRSSAVPRSSTCSSTRSPGPGASPGAQLVTLVGVPGIGKSRLVAELAASVDAEPELILWRQGRSLPYGEGVTYWALDRDGEGAGGDPRDRLRRRGGPEAGDGGRGTLIADPQAAAWVEAPPAPARRPRGQRRRRGRPARRGVRGLAPVLRGARRAAARSCSSSRTCTGPTTTCSTSSTTSSTGRATCRCSSSARRAPSCSSGGRAGAAASATRRRSRSRRSPRRTRHD